MNIETSPRLTRDETNTLYTLIEQLALEHPESRSFKWAYHRTKAEGLCYAYEWSDGVRKYVGRIEFRRGEDKEIDLRNPIIEVDTARFTQRELDAHRRLLEWCIGMSRPEFERVAVGWA